MDFVRGWIFQVAGIIALSAICDIIMLEGEMKKYIKPVLGFVLILAVIKPVAGLSSESIRLDIAGEVLDRTIEISDETDDIQRTEILKMYEEKLAAKMEEEIKTQCEKDVKATVKAKEGDKIGEIEQIFIEVPTLKDEVINTEVIKNCIDKKFGIDKDRIDIKLTERRD
jgi:stage III sporulation protein AF